MRPGCGCKNRGGNRTANGYKITSPCDGHRFSGIYAHEDVLVNWEKVAE